MRRIRSSVALVAALTAPVVFLVVETAGMKFP
jgi:hypothetical protein